MLAHMQALHGGVHPASQRRGKASGVEARGAVHLGSCQRLAAVQAKGRARMGHARQLGVAVSATAAPTTAGPSSSSTSDDDSGLFDVVVVGAGISGLTTAQARRACPAGCRRRRLQQSLRYPPLLLEELSALALTLETPRRPAPPRGRRWRRSTARPWGACW